MIPPEPEPVIPEYTYATSQSMPIGSTTGTLYTDIQFEGSPCNIKAINESESVTLFTHILLYEVDGTNYCYFIYGTGSTVRGILGNNAEIGQTIQVYNINKSTGVVTTYNMQYIESSTPSDYFENIRTRNFTLVQRS